MNSGIRFCATILGTAALAIAQHSVYAQSPLQRARALIDQGDAVEALALLQPLEATESGNVDFDYALALATLDAGDALTASFVFERILTLNPDFHGARIDYGRALLEMNKVSEARREFERARAAGPPPQASTVIDEYLLLIERRERRAKFSGYLSAGTRAGYDTNVNSATDLNEFLGFNLSETSRASDSEFFEAGLSAGGAMAVAPRLVLSSRLSLRARRNAQASFADSDVVAGSVRLDHATATQRRSVTARAFTQYVDGDRNSSAIAAQGTWLWRTRGDLWLGPVATLAAVRYNDALEIKDINQWTIGGAGEWQFGADGQGMLTGSITTGRDRPQRDSSRYGRDFTSLDVALNWQFSSTLSGSWGAAWQRSDFDNVFFEQVFDTPREDTSIRTRAALDWRFAPRWRLAHSLSYRLNDTDVTVFEFERFEATLGLRYVWH